MSHEMMPNGNEVRLPLSRLRTVAARYVLNTVDGMALVQAADALLDAGIYSWSLGELATTSQPTLRAAGPLFESALKELAIPLPSSPEEAARALIRELLCGVIEGRESPYRAMESLWSGLSDPLRFDRRLKNLEEERELLCLWYRYDVLGFAEAGYISREEAARQAANVDTQVLEASRSWMCQNGPRLIDPYWLSWNGGLVRKLAQAIARERAWDRLPILADDLEEAGCGNAELIEHCRAGENHMEYCWVVEIVRVKDTVKSP